jgi:transposase
VSKGSGLTRGDVRRNARKAALRALVPYANVVLGLDLGEKKHAMVLADRDGRALWRRSPQVRGHELGRYLDGVAERAAQAGFAG